MFTKIQKRTNKNVCKKILFVKCLYDFLVFGSERRDFHKKSYKHFYKQFWIFTKIQTNFTKIQTFFTNILITKWIFTKIQKIQKHCYCSCNCYCNCVSFVSMPTASKRKPRGAALPSTWRQRRSQWGLLNILREHKVALKRLKV